MTEKQKKEVKLLTAFAKNLNYNGVKIFTDYGAKKAVRDFLKQEVKK